MIQEFVDRFMAAEPILLERFAATPPDSYREIVSAVVETVRGDEEYGVPDPERIHEINDSHYQGTLVYVIGAGGYQPDDYWYVKVGYGSCSGCDTLESIRSYTADPPMPDQASQYWTLALHVVQGLKKMGSDVV